MAFIKINPEGMLTVINNLDERASAVDTERTNIDNSSSDNHDPVTSVVTATDPLPAPLAPSQTSGPSLPGLNSCSTNLNACAGNIRALAEELRTRRQEAIDMNSSGITPADANGTVSYYLPDPPEGTVDTEEYWNNTDTADNVKKYNSESAANGKAEATALAEARKDGKSSDGRTADEIMAEIAKHQDIPAYGASFVETTGAAKMLDMPIDDQNDHKDISDMVKTFGHVLSAASLCYQSSPYPSQVEKPGSGKYDLASDIYNAITEKGKEGRVTALDAYMNVPDTKYGTDFLVDLAGRVETIEDWPTLDDMTSSYTGPNPRPNENYLFGHTGDPLAAVMGAMGNNPDAAIGYLAPSDGDGPFVDGDIYSPSPNAQKRMDMLANRTWDGWSVKGLSAAFAGASASRMPPAPGSDTDDRATWATARGIGILADQTISPGDAARNTGIMLGNCGPEMLALARGNKTIEMSEEEVYKTTSLANQGIDKGSLKSDMQTLMERISTDKNGAAAIGQGTVVYTNQRANAAAAEADTAERKQAVISETFNDGNAVIDWVDKTAEDNHTSDHKMAMAGANATARAISLIPGGSVPGALATTAISVADAQTITNNSSAATEDELATNALSVAAQNNALDGLDINAKSWHDPDTGAVTLDSEEKHADFDTWTSSLQRNEVANDSFIDTVRLLATK